MTDRNEALVRTAYKAHVRGDVAGMLEFVDPDLEWTYLDPGAEDPRPQTCRGRGELDKSVRRQADDRTFDVVTVRDGLIVGLRACRDRGEARSVAGIA